MSFFRKTTKSVKKVSGTVALVLSLTILLTSCSIPGMDGFKFPWNSEPEVNIEQSLGKRRTIPYSQMEYKRPDMDKMKAELEQIAKEIGSSASFEDLKKMDDRGGDIFDEFSTMRTLSELKHYHDMKDSFYDAENKFMREQTVEMQNIGNDINRAIIESKYAEEYRKFYGDHLYQSIVNSLKLSSKEVEPFMKERALLDSDYDNLIGSLTVEHEGKEYTLSELSELEDAETGYILREQFFEENADRFTELYAKMVELDKQTAKTLGFSSAAEMYYIRYERDYTPEQALQLCEKVKEIFSPIVMPVIYTPVETEETDLKKTFDKMPAALEKVDKELMDAWNHMISFELHDYEPIPGKQTDIGFTANLNMYDAPFCYGYWKNDFYSMSTVMHEFGHYYDSWLYYDKDIASSLDVAEIYSQGLELLLQEYIGDFIKNPDQARLASLQNFMQAITYQALYEEMQLRLYDMESFTSSEVAKLYLDLMVEYGFIPDASMVSETGEDHSWYAMPHIFNSPFYTISYTTSALVALQIWDQSQSDWRAGADTYLKLIHAEQNQPFSSLLEQAGLKRFDDEQMMRGIADRFAEKFKVDEFGFAA